MVAGHDIITHSIIKIFLESLVKLTLERKLFRKIVPFKIGKNGLFKIRKVVLFGLERMENFCRKDDILFKKDEKKIIRKE